MSLPGCFFFEEVKIGLTLLFASDRCCKIQRSWRSEARCTAVLFGFVFVVAAYAPDSGKDLEEHEKFGKDATNILQEGRRAGAESCHIAGDLNIELELLCIGDDEDQELREMYGPQCWSGGEADPRVLKKLMWSNIMKELNCKAASIWSSYGDRRERAFTHRHWKNMDVLHSWTVSDDIEPDVPLPFS